MESPSRALETLSSSALCALLITDLDPVDMNATCRTAATQRLSSCVTIDLHQRRRSTQLSIIRTQHLD